MIQNSSFSTSWLQYWQRRPQARLRLFCFPYAGGSASLFRSLSEYAPVHIEICPVQLPGRENRFTETPFSSLDPLIRALHSALMPYLDRPYAFFGHSMGALVCFELARSLRRSGQTPGPVHLFVSGHQAPQLPDTRPPANALPHDQFVEALRAFQGTPEEILQHTELLQILLPLLRADFAVCETYRYIPEPPLACPISAFGGQQDRDVSYDSLLAWREQTESPFQVRVFAGGHFFLHQKQAELYPLLFQALSH